MKIPSRLPFAAAKRIMRAKRNGIPYLVAFGALAFFLGIAVPAMAHPAKYTGYTAPKPERLKSDVQIVYDELNPAKSR